MKKNKEIFRGRQGQGLYSAQQLCGEEQLTDGVISAISTFLLLSSLLSICTFFV